MPGRLLVATNPYFDDSEGDAVSEPSASSWVDSSDDSFPGAPTANTGGMPDAPSNGAVPWFEEEPPAPSSSPTPTAPPRRPRPPARPTPATPASPVPKPEPVPAPAPAPTAAREPEPTPPPPAPKPQASPPQYPLEPEYTPPTPSPDEVVEDIPQVAPKPKKRRRSHDYDSLGEGVDSDASEYDAPATPKKTAPKKKSGIGGLIAYLNSGNNKDKGDSPEEDESSKSKKERKAATATAGGRWKVLAFRYTAWGLLALIGVLGLRSLLFPNTVDPNEVAAQVRVEIGENGFPVDAGVAFASRFTEEYFTFDPKHPSLREERLRGYLPTNSDDNWLSDQSASTVAQMVVSGPFLVGEPEFTEEQCDLSTATSFCRATFIFVAEVAESKTDRSKPNSNQTIDLEFKQPNWLYLSVPVVANPYGVAIGGAPGFTPGQIAVNEEVPQFLAPDDDAAGSLEAALPGFFDQWSKSDTAALTNLWAAPNAERIVYQGLGGEVALALGAESVSDVQVSVPLVDAETGEVGDLRDAVATVEWRRSDNQTVYRQSYRLKVVLVDLATNKWQVQDVEGGWFGVTDDEDFANSKPEAEGDSGSEPVPVLPAESPETGLS